MGIREHKCIQKVNPSGVIVNKIYSLDSLRQWQFWREHRFLKSNEMQRNASDALLPHENFDLGLGVWPRQKCLHRSLFWHFVSAHSILLLRMLSLHYSLSLLIQFTGGLLLTPRILNPSLIHSLPHSNTIHPTKCVSHQIHQSFLSGIRFSSPFSFLLQSFHSHLGKPP